MQIVLSSSRHHGRKTAVYYAHVYLHMCCEINYSHKILNANRVSLVKNYHIIQTKTICIKKIAVLFKNILMRTANINNNRSINTLIKLKFQCFGTSRNFRYMDVNSLSSILMYFQFFSTKVFKNCLQISLKYILSWRHSIVMLNILKKI